MPDASAITCVLGPTNTGKTHRAVERMLEHDSGMIGLPLRLLAREVYDRVSARVGEARVALVTGEEKRVPRRPDYWICTVEAMPMDREVDFLAVDEIQLAAHAQRGHVFTERLLAGRGRRETWFMGADTMAPLVSELVPTARIASYPRLSRLSSAGATKLARLPPRSAVVAFSTAEVYALAERLRATRGGAAVVLGALSPRTRNAQVAMFQAGEVDYLVATDAIGMGLNLHVSHVAFAALRKFDGRDVRGLDPAELAQIAGRAGRHLEDGTFGTLAPLALAPEIAEAIEAHRFPAVRRLVYRNADVDFSSIEALLASLRARPRSRSLALVEGAEDTAALEKLAQRPAIRARAVGPERVALLWDVCRIPDYRKLLLDTHVDLCAELFLQLSGPRGVVDPDFMRTRIDEIDDLSGDIDTLVTRIASIRTFTYVSSHARWVEDAGAFQERTREVEDRLSDALHERLVQRFVERGAGGRRGVRARAHPRHPDAPLSPSDPAPTHPFAALAALRARMAPEPAAPAHDGDALEEVIAATHERFELDARGRILFEGEPVGELARGASLLLPDVKVVGHDDAGAGTRARLQRRLLAFARDAVGELLGPLRADEVRGLSPAARGIVYQLEQGLGTALAAGAARQLEELEPRDREALAALGVVIGARVLFVPALLRPHAIARRFALVRAFRGGRTILTCPRPGAVSMRAAREIAPADYLAIGFPVFGTRALRADVAERVHRALSDEAARPEVARISSWLGCPAREATRVAAALA